MQWYKSETPETFGIILTTLVPDICTCHKHCDSTPLTWARWVPARASDHSSSYGQQQPEQMWIRCRAPTKAVQSFETVCWLSWVVSCTRVSLRTLLGSLRMKDSRPRCTLLWHFCVICSYPGRYLWLPCITCDCWVTFCGVRFWVATETVSVDPSHQARL